MIMNRLIFSEGGQPVFLEDLKLIQDNMVNLIQSLFPLTGGQFSTDDYGIANVTDLSIYATPRHVNRGDNLVIVQAHKLITKDGVYDVPESTIGEQDVDTSGIDVMSCYYVLNEEIIEKREFEDGVVRGVVKSLTAKIVGRKPTSGVYYALKEVPSLDAMQAVINKNVRTDYLIKQEEY